jgi:hypothetical protein
MQLILKKWEWRASNNSSVAGQGQVRGLCELHKVRIKSLLNSPACEKEKFTEKVKSCLTGVNQKTFASTTSNYNTTD